MKEICNSPICFICNLPVTRLDTPASGSVYSRLNLYFHCVSCGLCITSYFETFVCPVCFHKIYILILDKVGIIFCSNPKCSGYEVKITNNRKEKVTIFYLGNNISTLIVETNFIKIMNIVNLKEETRENEKIRKFFNKILKVKKLDKDYFF